jgi:hypothetical protein
MKNGLLHAKRQQTMSSIS